MNGANDNYIHVVISKGGTKDAVSQNELSFSPQYTTPHIQGSGSKIENVRSDLINLALIQAGKSALNYAISNYGELTGDYYTQEMINSIIQVVGMGVTAMSSTLGAVGVGVQLSLSGINRLIDVKKSKIKSKNMQERLGISFSGSR